MNDFSERKRSILPRILLIVGGIIVGILLLRIIGLDLTWKSENTEVHRKPGDRNEQTSRKSEVIDKEKDQLLESLADYFSGETTLDQATKDRLVEYMNITKDELDFYRLVGNEKRAGNSRSWRSAIQQSRPVYLKVKEIIGEMVYKPHHKVDNDDLKGILNDDQKLRDYCGQLAKQMNTSSSDLMWFSNQVDNEKISSWAFFIYQQ